MPKLIVGCGYLGRRVAQNWLHAGEKVFAVTRTAERATELAAAGIEPLVGNVAEQPLPPFPVVDTLLFALGHERASGASQPNMHCQALANTLAALSQRVARIIYVSSLGVYSQNQGEWVDEASPCLPLRTGGRACLAAEKLLQASPFGNRAMVLRAAGIYGPGRIPRRADLAAGRPLAVEAEGYLNLIHVSDLARVVLAAEHHSPPGTLVVSDGSPVLRRDYYAHLAELLGAPPPTFVPPVAGSPEHERSGANKRANSERLRQEWKVPLEFPDYRAGLKSIVQAERGGT